MLTRLLPFHIPDNHKLGNLVSRRHDDYAPAPPVRLGALFAAPGSTTLFFLEVRVVAGDACGTQELRCVRLNPSDPAFGREFPIASVPFEFQDEAMISVLRRGLHLN
jgi:hypothetical protein